MLEPLLLLAGVLAIGAAAYLVHRRRRQAALAQSKLLERKVRRRQRAEAWARMIEENRAGQDAGDPATS